MVGTLQTHQVFIIHAKTIILNYLRPTLNEATGIDRPRNPPVTCGNKSSSIVSPIDGTQVPTLKVRFPNFPFSAATNFQDEVVLPQIFLENS